MAESSFSPPADIDERRTTVSRFQKGDLPERTKRFALRILDLIDHLPQNTKAWVVGRQLVRAGTGIGANVCEADGALTDREFAQLANIARREAAEAKYWLLLCAESRGMLSRSTGVEEIIVEADELHRILAVIVRKTQRLLR